MDKKEKRKGIIIWKIGRVYEKRKGEEEGE